MGMELSLSWDEITELYFPLEHDCEGAVLPLMVVIWGRFEPKYGPSSAHPTEILTLRFGRREKAKAYKIRERWWAVEAAK